MPNSKPDTGKGQREIGKEQEIRVFNYISGFGPVTVKQIAEHLGITTNGIYKYLKRMINQNDIEQVIIREPNKPGDNMKEFKGYQLTE